MSMEGLLGRISAVNLLACILHVGRVVDWELQALHYACLHAHPVESRLCMEYAHTHAHRHTYANAIYLPQIANLFVGLLV